MCLTVLSVAPVPSLMAVPIRVLAVPGGTALAAAELKPVGLSTAWKAPPPAVGVCSSGTTTQLLFADDSSLQGCTRPDACL